LLKNTEKGGTPNWTAYFLMIEPQKVVLKNKSYMWIGRRAFLDSLKKTLHCWHRRCYCFSTRWKHDGDQGGYQNFVGKILFIAIFWQKSDKRTIYNVIYRDSKSGPSYIKRFNVSRCRDVWFD
jgi:hypothetical protein